MTRSFGRYHAVEHASFEIWPCEIAAIVGHESSGASELARMMLGLLKPTEGTIKVLGKDPYAGDTSTLKRVGSCLQPTAFYDSWTGRRNLEYAADLSGNRDLQRLNWAITSTGLAGRIDDWVLGYTESFRQRLALARALVAKPEILILEEPFAKLDAETTAHMTGLFRRLARDAETAILIVSSSLEDVTRYVKRVIVIDGGRILHDGPTAQIQAAGREVELTVDKAENAAEDLVRIRGISAELASAETLRIGEHVDVADVVAFLSGRRYKVTGVARHEMTLNDVLLRLASGPLPPPPSIAPDPEDVRDPLDLLDDGTSDLSAFLKTSGDQAEGDDN